MSKSRGFRYSEPNIETMQIRAKRQADSHGALSGYGHHKIIYCPEGIPVELAIFSILAAFAVSFGVLFRAASLAGRRRKKRSAATPGEGSTTWYEDLKQAAADLAWFGRCLPLLVGWIPPVSVPTCMFSSNCGFC